jgi:NADPH:quinone reductase-like Zn-dependent oxidoreductase
MKALRISQHGPVSELKASDTPEPKPGPGEVKVRVEVAGVNPSDVLSILGRFPNAQLPRVVGRDFAGTIVEGPSELVGTPVWGSGGDLGITRDGTHAEYLVIPRDAAARRPKNVSAEQGAAAGVPFLAAWHCMEEARVSEGEWVIVSGAAGAVGHAAIQLVHARRAKVIALVKDEAEAQRVSSEGVAAVARSDRDELAEVVKQVTGGKGCQVALNGVGGAVFRQLFDALAEHGRMVIYSAGAGREATLDLFLFLRRWISFHGVNTSTLDATQCAEALRQLTPLFEQGVLRPHDVSARYSLAEAVRAFEHVEKSLPGRAVLVPGA